MKKSNESEKEIYKQKIIEMVERIESQDYLFKIYHYTIAKYRRENKEKETDS